jgi:hypothetical protein
MKLLDWKKTFFLVLLAGIVLRLWGIDFGLPYILHQDEPIVVNHAMAYGTGDLNPHFFVIPPLPSYIVFFFYGLYFLAGKAIGYFSSANDLAALFFADLPGLRAERSFRAVRPEALRGNVLRY